jgi:hypothetical protein
MNKAALSTACVLIAGQCFASLPVLADAISPGISNTPQRTYSKEKPQSDLYGSGSASHYTEASVLRFEGEQATEDHKLDLAIKKLSKAVQLDPGDPDGHLLLARAMSKQIDDSKEVSPELLNNALSEWRLLWHHDADYLEQREAHNEAKRLMKIAKAMQKKGTNEKDSRIATKKDDTVHDGL